MVFKYNPRKIRSKGALIVLLWTFTAFLIAIHKSNFRLYVSAFSFFILVSLPIVGYLSDEFIGRYKVIYYSLWITFASVVSINVLALTSFGESNTKSASIVGYCLHVIAGIGVAGILVNTLQFGLDQLTDLASSNITSYISWYCWTGSFGFVVNVISQSCLCGVYDSKISHFIHPLLLTIIFIIHFSTGKHLIIEPVAKKRPFTQIYQVLKYAVKNKHPKNRSAFTYWEDKPYSRIDLGKNKYGGPFTTEQVEDVKTFFRLLPTIFLMCLLGGEVFVLSQIHYENDVDSQTCSEWPLARYLAACYKVSFLQISNPSTICIFIPVLEIFLYPVLSHMRCCTRIGILQKIIVGGLLILVAKIGLLTLETVNTVNLANNNDTCHFDEKNWPLIHQRDYRNLKWLVIIQVFSAVTVYIMITSVLEFVCAQAPYSMRGLLIGMTYLAAGVALALSWATLALFEFLTKYDIKRCGIWYYTASAAFSCLVIGLLLVALKRYTLRRRDDILSNNHMFAVNYFSKYVNFEIRRNRIRS